MANISLVAQQQKTLLKKTAPPTERWKADNRWHQCCDTRAVVIAVMLLTRDRKEKFFSLPMITDVVVDLSRKSKNFEGAADFRKAFGDHLVKDIVDTVELCVPLLCQLGVLIPLPNQKLARGKKMEIVYQVDVRGPVGLVTRYPILAQRVRKVLQGPSRVREPV